MASPSPVTMPAFQLTSSPQYVVKIASTVVGQGNNFQLTSTVPVSKVARIGDTTKSTSRKPVENSWSIDLYNSEDFSELGLILGFTMPGSGWSGTESITLDPTASAYTLTLEVYDGATGVSDTLLGTYTLTNAVTTGLTLTIGADDDASTAQMTGECDSWDLTPVSGVGA